MVAIHADPDSPEHTYTDDLMRLTYDEVSETLYVDQSVEGKYKWVGRYPLNLRGQPWTDLETPALWMYHICDVAGPALDFAISDKRFEKAIEPVAEFFRVVMQTAWPEAS